MPAEKKSKSTTVKKNNSGGSRKKSVSQSKNSGSGGSNTAFFVLVIVILITIIVLMLNRFYDKGAFRIPDFRKMIPASDENKDKKPELQKEKTQEEEKTGDKEKQKTDSVIKDGRDDKDKQPFELQKEVNLYLLKLDEKTERIYLSPVKRTVTDKDILASTLENLIKGPTRRERDSGYITAVPDGLKIRGISINGKIAEIDFNSAIEEGAAGDILLKRVQQIVYTSTQFENIDSIIIKINGQRRKSMGSDGFSISGPLKR